MTQRLLQWMLMVVHIITVVHSQCPWSKNVVELQGSCACSYNLAQELTLQCSLVNFTVLISALQNYASSQTIDLLYVHNSSIVELPDGFLRHNTINNIQLSRCEIRSISSRAFQGQEETLKNLNLQDNHLTHVPIDALRNLNSLALVDLSGNRITYIPDDAFITLRLATLKLSDNNLTLSDHSFRGLEKSLKNLNLKGTRLKEFPQAVHHLATLAFLDLAQNNIRHLNGHVLAHLDSLTALNLERNMIQSLDSETFIGVNDTLSSLSLLNNLIVDFPKEALAPLTELRVLDVGFNLITVLPDDAFRTIKSLTLLALDGNPLPTLPEVAFSHLNGTLRGLSLGGRFLECDCKIRWITEWIRDTDLQVTSRERNPQFCGSPTELKTKSFYQLSPTELKCVEKTAIKENDGFIPIPPSTTIRTGIPHHVKEPVSEELPEVDEDEEELDHLPPVHSSVVPVSTSTPSSVRKPYTNAPKPFSADPPIARYPTPSSPYRNGNPFGQHLSTNKPSNKGQAPIVPSSPTRAARPTRPKPIAHLNSSPLNNRPSLVLNNNGNDYSEREVIVKDAYRQDTSVVIHWDSETTNILGFRVVYRLFGDNNFQPGPPLDPSEREFKIKNVPSQESLVVCVISLEESNVTPETVPFSQCREIRTETLASTHMDKIIIAASAAICGTVVIAVVVFICCNRKRAKASEKERLSNVLAPTVSTTAPSLIGSQQTPLASLGSLGLGLASGPKDWDQLSMYSSRSIPRARMYHGERPGSVMGSVNGGYIPDDARSHLSGYSMGKAGIGLARSRSLADGQSQRSMSALSGRYLPSHGLHGPGMAMGMGLGMGLGVPNMGISLSRPGSMNNLWQEAMLNNDMYLRNQGLVRL